MDTSTIESESSDEDSANSILAPNPKRPRIPVRRLGDSDSESEESEQDKEQRQAGSRSPAFKAPFPTKRSTSATPTSHVQSPVSSVQYGV